MKLKNNTILSLWSRFHTNSLFRNAIYLMLGTAVLSGFGFFFWLINARLFPIADIGIATTLISVMNLIALLSLVGFDSVFVRFLPTSNQKNQKMNTGVILVSFAATILSVGFILNVDRISPRIAFINNNPMHEFIFIFASVMSALNLLIDAVYLSGRKTIYTLFINILFSIFKVAGPFAFVGFGAMGIFMAVAFAQTIGTLVSLGIMIGKFDYRPAPRIDQSIVAMVWRYSVANYLAGVLTLLPTAILPIIITNAIGLEASAYFYIVMMMGNLLYTIPWSVTRSLFAEGSHDEKTLGENIKKSVRIIGLLLIPSMGLLLLTGKYILQIFGKEYASGGIHFLYYVIITGIVISGSAIYNSFFRVKKLLNSIIILNLFSTISILGFSYMLLSYGLTGIGLAWFIGNTVPCVVGYLFYRRYS